MKINEVILICILVLIMSSFWFDAFVSYKIYEKDTDYFIEREEHKRLVSWLDSNNDYWDINNPIFSQLIIYILSWFCLCFYYQFYLIDNSKDSKVYYFCFIVLSIMLVYVSFVHIFGGLSWYI